MSGDLTAHASVTINAGKKEVWQALIDPEAIRHYMFGTCVISDWQEGSTIIWQGQFDGKPYKDKGNVLKVIPEETLQYNHFSPLTGMSDTPENYHTIIIHLEPDVSGNTTRVSLFQDNKKSEEARKHSEENWRIMLEELKGFVEQRH